MILDPVRTARQRGIVQKWLQADGKGTSVAITGFGKTYVGKLAIDETFQRGLWRTLVVVPTLYLQDQWYKRFSEWGLTNAEVLVINTAVKEDREVDLLILDEIHRYTAPIFGQIFDRVSYKMILGLTATMPEGDEKMELIARYAPIIDTVTMEESLKHNWVSEFTVYNLAVRLTDEEKAEYDKYTRQFNRFFAFFGHDFDLAIRCLNDNQASSAWARQLNRTQQEIKGNAANWMRYMRKRKDLLHTLPSKLAAARDIVHLFPGHKVITFAETTESAENLARMIGNDAQAYHSSMKGHIGIDGNSLSGKKARNDVLRRFDSKDDAVNCRVLCTAKALDEGADLPEIDLSITVSGTSKVIQGTQRNGRSIRFVKGKHTIIVELYAEGTQDLRWLNSRQKKTPKDSIRWITSLEEIL